MKFENRNYALACSFVDELARSGLRHVCICPGSRSSPITIGFARHPSVKTWVHLDERSAAFFTLGIGKALGEPAAVVCTSGTAVANLLPAVVEAKYSYTPLLLLTADRPPETWEWGASQTILQSRIFGVHAKWATDIPTVEVTGDLLRYVRATACRAMAEAYAAPAGPVHVNLSFREPLAPEEVAEDFDWRSLRQDNQAWEGRPQDSPFISVPNPRATISNEPIDELSKKLAGIERGVIVCGPQSSPDFPDKVSRLATALKYPILSDSLSQVRCGPHDRGQVIDNYDLFLRHEGTSTQLAPKVIMRFGAIPTSKVLNRYLERYRSVEQILVAEEGWHDPTHLASEIIRGDVVELCDQLTLRLQLESSPSSWSEEWLSVRNRVNEASQAALGDMDELFEGKVFSEIENMLPDEAILFAGNSMPVRDMDAFLSKTSKSVHCMANRGASGIDGVVSTALGVGAATDAPLVLALGDLSFYHDMNGLLPAKQHQINVTIVVINNDGGGVFSFLPQANHTDVFEEYFGTPHGLEFRSAAELYGLQYTKISSWDEFRQAVSSSLSMMGTNIIEVPGDRARNMDLHKGLWGTVSNALHVHAKE